VRDLTAPSWSGFGLLPRHWDLLIALATKEIRVRYKQSVMGFLWAILLPLLIVAAGVVVREAMTFVSGGATSPSLLPILVKSAPWAFFVSSLRFGTESLVKHSNLVTKVYFPRQVVPYAAVLAALFDFCVAGSLVALALAVAGVGVSPQLVWVPPLIVLLVMLTTGAVLLLSCANLFFRDVRYLVESFLTFGVFFTPVFFEARMFQRWAPMLLLNPIGALLEALSDVIVLHRAPDPFWLGYAACWAIGLFVAARVAFRSAEPLFAEKI